MRQINDMQLELLRIITVSFEPGDTYKEYHDKVDAAWKELLSRDEDER